MRRYIDTPTSRMLRGSVEWAAEYRHNLLVTGPAGIGKTETLREVARRDPRAVLVTMSPARHSMRGVLSMVLEAFGLSSSSMHLSMMADVLDARMPQEAQAGRFLMIDEAQLLPATAMRQLVGYSDHVDWPLPVILVGNEHALKKTRANAAAYDQIKSRMTKHLQVPSISAGDIEAFGVCWDVMGRDAYALLQTFGAGRNCREIDRLLGEAKRLAGAGAIKLAALRDAIGSLHGRELAANLTRAREIA